MSGGAGSSGASGAGTSGGAGASGTSGGAGNGGSGTSPVLGGCAIYPADNAWNTRIDDTTAFPTDPSSAAILQNISDHAQKAYEHNLHPDFGSNFGIPFAIVPETQAKVAIHFNEDPTESDPGPYPIPPGAQIEADTDGHVLVLQQGVCAVYEMGNSSFDNPGWSCGWGAKFDLSTNTPRTTPGAACPTSADAAGLSIFAGLAKYEEVAAGHINHAIRFTVRASRQAFVRPATHYASSNTDAAFPPMGMRVRLKAVPAGLTGQAKIVATALKEYGMILADNGSNWFITGAPNAGWSDDDLNQLKDIPETDFEVVKMDKIYTSTDCP